MSWTSEWSEFINVLQLGKYFSESSKIIDSKSTS